MSRPEFDVWAYGETVGLVREEPVARLLTIRPAYSSNERYQRPPLYSATTARPSASPRKRMRRGSRSDAHREPPVVQRDQGPGIDRPRHLVGPLQHECALAREDAQQGSPRVVVAVEAGRAPERLGEVVRL